MWANLEIATTPAGIVADIRNTLKLFDIWASGSQTWQEALNHLTQKNEEVGITIVFNGVVENNTSWPISVQECRGFVLVDPIAPFMFINNSDGKAAQLFTIVHELAPPLARRCRVKAKTAAPPAL